MCIISCAVLNIYIYMTLYIKWEVYCTHSESRFCMHSRRNLYSKGTLEIYISEFVLCGKGVLFRRFQMYCNYREKKFGDLKLCPL